MPSANHVVATGSLRLPADLRDKLRSAAEVGGRSINAEIVFRLERSFDPSRAIHVDLARALEEHIEREVKSRLRAVAANLAKGAE